MGRAGAYDAAMAEVAGEHVACMVRESLANVARHAGASQAHVEVVVASGAVEVRVTDDGVGPGGAVGMSGGGNGLRNLRDRADRVGGTFVFGAAPSGGGARACWRA